MEPSASVSVVIPTYNRAEFLEETIGSVLRQTTPVHEIIVIDDGSTDGTCELVRRFGEAIVFETQEKRGSAAARNRALSLATGDWVAFLDSDDVWERTKIEKQLRYASQHPQCALVHAGYYEFGDRERTLSSAQHFLDGEYRVDYLLFAEDWICTSTVLVRRSVPMAFREWATAATSEDIIFFADLLRLGCQFGYVDERLAGYRVHADAANSQSGSQVQGLSFQWRWIHEALAAQPEEQLRLQTNILAKAGDAMSLAKWARNWPRYWEWRNWLTEHWPSHIPRPEVLHERIYPSAAYRLKDDLEAVTHRWFRDRPERAASRTMGADAAPRNTR